MELNNLLRSTRDITPSGPGRGGTRRRGSPVEVAARFPASSLAWGTLAEAALADGNTIEAYAYARTGYHRGLDLLRRNGWKGHGPVPWEHEPNRGFLRCLAVLGKAAGGHRGDRKRPSAARPSCATRPRPPRTYWAETWLPGWSSDGQDAWVSSPYDQPGTASASTGDQSAPKRARSLVAVVDVLSFTTAVTVAADLGIDGLPVPLARQTAVAVRQTVRRSARGRPSEAGPMTSACPR